MSPNINLLIATIVINFRQFRTTSGAATSSEYTENGLVRDGTPCGTNLICVNQTCVSIFPYIDQTKCPTSSNNIECYGQGVREIFKQKYKREKKKQKKNSRFFNLKCKLINRIFRMHYRCTESDKNLCRFTDVIFVYPTLCVFS